MAFGMMMLGLLALAALTGTAVQLLRDGYGRIPTRR
jgi:hypothetical protein